VASEIRHRRHHCSAYRNEHDIKRRDQDFDKKSLYLKGCTLKRLTDEFPEKAGQNVALISCSESCRTQAQLRGVQAVADRAVF